MVPEGTERGKGMSDAVKKFFEKVEKEPGLKAKLGSIAKGKLDEVVKIAESAGYRFSAAELAAFQKTAAGQNLSEAELDMVAGGKASTGCAELYCGAGTYVR